MPIGFPAVTKYTPSGMLVNQRITFVSLLDTMGNYITGLTNFLISKGYTCSGSSNGTVAGMDAVNRCTTAAGFAVRATVAAAAQSWIVVRAANGAQTLYSYQGSGDDIARVSFSPSGSFLAAGTATHQPTATDEMVMSTGITIVGSTASADRVYNVWVDPAANGWRSCVFRSNINVGQSLGVELYNPALLISPATAPVPVWGFCYTPANMSAMFNGGTAQGAGTAAVVSGCGGQARLVVAGTPVNSLLGATFKSFGGATGIAEDGVNLESNGSTPAIRTLGLYSSTTGSRGDVGERFDWHYCHDRQAAGQTDTGKNWILINDQSAAGTKGGVIWPWDTVSTPVVA